MNRQLKPFPMDTDDPSNPDSEQPAPYTPQTFAEHAAEQKAATGKGRRWTLIIAIMMLVVLVAGGLGAYWWYQHKKQATPAKQQSTTNTHPAPSAAASTATTTKTYTSTGKDLNLSFSYPSDWTASPASGDNASDQTITLNSPLASITDVSGHNITGKVTVALRPGSANISELESGKATAGQASVQFAYDKPTTAQHQYPYLTFIHLNGGPNPSSAFEEVVITGINQFTKDQSITPTSLGALDPIISARFYNCSSQDCTDLTSTPLSITNSTWQNTQVFKQTQALFQSLQLN